ncbi:translation initiation factor eIF-2 beta subunit [Naganishia albida]|nr:translation initiation factor eIF-2 beta subunit [Naganishia albida]
MSAEEMNNTTPAEEPMFAGLKKKSKKAKVNFDDFMSQDAPTTAADVASATVAEEAKEMDAGGAAPADAPAADDGTDMFADLKKKSKKKKKEIPLDLEASTPGDATPTTETTADAGEMGDFGDLKKKKKSSKKKAAFDIEAFEKEIEGGENNDEGGDYNGDSAELDREIGDDVFGSNENPEADDAASKLGHEAWVGTDRDYTYPELLTRFYALLHSHNPELAGDKKKFTLVPPQVNREGTKKTVFANIADICRRMRRQPKHLIEFIYAELGTSGSVDGSNRLMIKGRYTQKNIENVLKKYIVEYVMCKTCKSSDTILEKENRLYFIICEACGSKRSVSAIKTGFQAQIGRRKAQAT